MTPPPPPVHHDRATVLAWFDDDGGDIDGRALLANLRLLRRDNDWRVDARVGATVWDIPLVYWPTGATETIRLEPVAGSGDAVWRRVS